MIPIQQTKFAIKNSKGEFVQRGNCYAACIASLLEVPITEVPNVEVLFHINETYYYEVMSTWLKSVGFELNTDDRFKVYHDEFLDTSDFRDRQHLRYSLKNKYYLVSGKSTRGVYHLCIYKEGKLVHDPYPSKEGLLEISNFQSLDKAE